MKKSVCLWASLICLFVFQVIPVFAESSGSENDAAPLSGKNLIFSIKDMVFEDGVFEFEESITELAKGLSFDAKIDIYNECNTSILKCIGAFLLNGSVGFGLGSLSMGDYEGFRIQVFSELGGIAFLLGGFYLYGSALEAESFGRIKMYSSRLCIIGGSFLLGFSVGYGVSRPWIYRNNRNALLRKELGLSKTRLLVAPVLDAENDSYGVSVSVSL